MIAGNRWSGPWRLEEPFGGPDGFWSLPSKWWVRSYEDEAGVWKGTDYHQLRPNWKLKILWWLGL